MFSYRRIIFNICINIKIHMYIKDLIKELNMIYIIHKVIFLGLHICINLFLL